VKVWLDGALVDEGDARISPFDRGFLLGDGVFETFRSYERRLPMLGAHLERLEAGARVLRLSIPAIKDIMSAVRGLLYANVGEDVRLRITVTSGAGPPGLARANSPPTILITASSLRAWPETASAIVAGWPHDEYSPLAGVKTTSRADSVLALTHAHQSGADEAIFRNMAGNLCEATTANVFCVRRGRVETPPLSAGCIPGITRALVLRLCSELGIEGVEADRPQHVLMSADELFLTSSTRGIQPLVVVEGRPVGTGRPGPVTLRLIDAFRETVASMPDD
jgi:branched-chain amino acid aminotransferase